MATVLTSIKAVIITLILFTACIYLQQMERGVTISKECWFLFLVGCIASITLITPTSKVRLNYLDIFVTSFLFYVMYNEFIHSSSIDFKCLLPLGLIVFYFSIKSEAININKVEPLINLTLTSLLILLGIAQLAGLIESLNPNFPITGFFFNPAPYSIFLGTMLMPIAYYFFFTISKVYV